MKRLVPAISVFRVLLALGLIAIAVPANAQFRRFELASHFTSLGVGERTPGLGATLTYNITRRLALESTLNFFPSDPRTNLGLDLPVSQGWKTGNILQGQFGAKAVVLRTRNTQFFLKAKPGFVSFSDLRYRFSPGIGPLGNADVTAFAGRQTGFALDVGGGVEFLANRRTYIRFDIGDTYFRYNPFVTTINGPGLSGVVSIPFTFQGSSVHTVQISTGIGFRFGKAR